MTANVQASAMQAACMATGCLRRMSFLKSQDAPAPFVAAQSPPVVPAPSVAVVPAVPTHLSSVVKEQEAAGWSPSKLNSLSFFLGNSQPTARPAAAAQLAGPDANQRPYLGLKYLLRAGPPGSTVPATWSSHYTHKPAGIQAPQGSMAAAAARPSSGRYAPYSLQPPSKANTGWVLDSAHCLWMWQMCAKLRCICSLPITS